MVSRNANKHAVAISGRWPETAVQTNRHSVYQILILIREEAPNQHAKASPAWHVDDQMVRVPAGNGTDIDVASLKGGREPI